MIALVTLLLVPIALALSADIDPVSNPVYKCKFDAGQIVIQQAEASGDVTGDGQARQYVMDKLKLGRRAPGLPAFFFQPDLTRWQWLNDQGEPLESTACSEQPTLKTG